MVRFSKAKKSAVPQRKSLLVKSVQIDQIQSELGLLDFDFVSSTNMLAGRL